MKHMGLLLSYNDYSSGYLLQWLSTPMVIYSNGYLLDKVCRLHYRPGHRKIVTSALSSSVAQLVDMALATPG